MALRYNNRRLAPLAEIVRRCSYAHGARPPSTFCSVSEATAVRLALESSGIALASTRSSVEKSPRTSLLRLTPALLGFRVVGRAKCGYGSVPLATPDDFAEARAEAQKSIEFLAPEVAFMRRCLPQAMVLCPFGTPGGHTLGARAAGMPAVLMDVNVLHTSRRFFDHHDNASPLVSVLKGDALDPEAREAAIQSHPLQRDCVLNFDCPPCAPNATPVISGSRAGPDHRCITSSIWNLPPPSTDPIEVLVRRWYWNRPVVLEYPFPVPPASQHHPASQDPWAVPVPSGRSSTTWAVPVPLGRSSTRERLPNH